MAVGTLALFYPVFLPLGTAAIAYAGHRAVHMDWRMLLTQFLTGPGRTSRILLVFFLVLNWKSLPLAWTVMTPPSNSPQSRDAADRPPLPGPHLPLLHLPHPAPAQGPPAARPLPLQRHLVAHIAP